MWISRERYDALEARIASLQERVRNLESHGGLTVYSEESDIYHHRYQSVTYTNDQLIGLLFDHLKLKPQFVEGSPAKPNSVALVERE